MFLNASLSRVRLFHRVSRFRLSGGDDVKPRWTLPSKDYLKYTYQPSIPDKHFMGAHWNYAPITMWFRHIRPTIENIASAGWTTAKSWIDVAYIPTARLFNAHCPGLLQKIVAAISAWATFSYIARAMYGDKMESWAFLDKLHSYSYSDRLAKEGFWNTDEMDSDARKKACNDTCVRLEGVWKDAIATATKERSFQALCEKLAVDPKDLPFTEIPTPVTWRFGLVPYHTADAQVFPENDRSDVAIETKPGADDHAHGHGEHIISGLESAKNIYLSAACATGAAAH